MWKSGTKCRVIFKKTMKNYRKKVLRFYEFVTLFRKKLLEILGRNLVCDKKVSHCDVFKTKVSQLKPLKFQRFWQFCDVFTLFYSINYMKEN